MKTDLFASDLHQFDMGWVAGVDEAGRGPLAAID